MTVTTLQHIKEPSPMITSNGEQHGLIKVVSNSVPDSDGKRFKEKDRESMKKLRSEESRMVKAKYLNRKGNNERLSRPYCRWDGDPMLTYHFIPEHVYEVPKGLVDEVNNKKSMKRSGLIGVNGKELMVDTQESSEHMFVPEGF